TLRPHTLPDGLLGVMARNLLKLRNLPERLLLYRGSWSCQEKPFRFSHFFLIWESRAWARPRKTASVPLFFFRRNGTPCRKDEDHRSGVGRGPLSQALEGGCGLLRHRGFRPSAGECRQHLSRFRCGHSFQHLNRKEDAARFTDSLEEIRWSVWPSWAGRA